MWPPCAANTVLHPLAKIEYYFYSDLGILCHSCYNACLSLPNRWGGDWRSIKSSQRCSMGYTFGEFEGHGNTVMLLWAGNPRFPCCMESAIVLLKYLPLSEILYIHGIPVAVTVAVTVRLRRWNTPIYRSWVGVAMHGLPLLERSWADPVSFNLCQRHGNVVVWTINCWATSVWYCPAYGRPMTFRVAGSNLTITIFHSSNDICLFYTNVLYCMNIVFCAITGTFIFQLFKNILDELPNCSFRHFVF